MTETRTVEPERRGRLACRPAIMRMCETHKKTDPEGDKDGDVDKRDRR